MSCGGRRRPVTVSRSTATSVWFTSRRASSPLARTAADARRLAIGAIERHRDIVLRACNALGGLVPGSGRLRARCRNGTPARSGAFPPIADEAGDALPAWPVRSTSRSRRGRGSPGAGGARARARPANRLAPARLHRWKGAISSRPSSSSGRLADEGRLRLSSRPRRSRPADARPVPSFATARAA